jgi:hypothetical protein
MTVNTRVMFRITLYYVPCQAISLSLSSLRLRFSSWKVTTTSYRNKETVDKGRPPELDYAAS